MVPSTLFLIFIFSSPPEIFQRDYSFYELSACKEAVEKIGKDTAALKANNSGAVVAFCRENRK